MYVKVDMSTIPPTAELCDADNFADFRVVASVPSHVWIDPDAVAELADRSEDISWNDRLADMVAYARDEGWVDDEGRVRAHVETEDS